MNQERQYTVADYKKVCYERGYHDGVRAQKKDTQQFIKEELHNANQMGRRRATEIVRDELYKIIGKGSTITIEDIKKAILDAILED